MSPKKATKQHPCPDCKVCQWCPASRCAICLGWIRRGAAGRKQAPRECTGACRKRTGDSYA